MINSKNKGGEFERLISKDFDKWWQEIPGTFWRTKVSGGSDEPGDIAPRWRQQHTEKVWWPFVVECKHYKSFNLLNLFRVDKNKGNLLLQWWKQVTASQNEAIELGYKVIPLRLLIIRINTYPILCIFNFDEFEDNAKQSLPSLRKFDTYLKLYKSSEANLVITRFETFKEVFTKEYLERLFK